MSSGFDNENEFIEHFNKANTFEELNNNLQKVVLKVNTGKIPNKIGAKKYGGANKADLSILLDDKEFSVSVKKGSGNSLHQEPVEEFIKFLKNEIEDNESIFNDIRFFIWGDLTYDGSGKIIDRMSGSELKKNYIERVNNIQRYFDNHKEKLINRFIIEGVVSKTKAEFLLYGNVIDCVIVSEDKVFQFAKNIAKNPISIGVLTFQAWNRNITGRHDMEKRRGQIQLKWGTLKTDLLSII